MVEGGNTDSRVSIQSRIPRSQQGETVVTVGSSRRDSRTRLPFLGTVLSMRKSRNAVVKKSSDVCMTATSRVAEEVIPVAIQSRATGA